MSPPNAALWYHPAITSVPAPAPSPPLAPHHPRVLLAVAVGGALGATARWAVGRLVDAVGSTDGPGAWPWATLIVNLAGCLVVGAAAVRLRRDTVPWAFVVTGVLGGFTTFSAFAVELDQLVDTDRPLAAAVYALVSLGGGAAAVALAAARAKEADDADRPSAGPVAG